MISKEAVGEFGVLIIVCLAVAGLVWLMLNVAGIPIPGWVVTAIWIALAAVFLIALIRLVTRT